MPKTNEPKGRRHRCSTDFMIGDKSLGHGECAWILRDGAVIRLKSRKQLGATAETVVVTKGHTPAPTDFAGTPVSGWSGLADATSVKPRDGMTDNSSPKLEARPRLVVTDGDDARTVHEIATAVASRGGRALVVGGAVRDALFAARYGTGVVPKDVDIEVYGIDAAELQAMLAERHRVDLAGAAFAVLKIHGSAIDVSIPRRESKAGQGHRGFLVESDPTMSVEDAARRRDFTINAMSFDPLTGELIDPYGGMADLESRRLRHVGAQFAEDPLRVLRGAQFIARFELDADPSTVALCRGLKHELGTLARERVWDETVKLIHKGVAPGGGVRFLDACDWLDVWPGVGPLKEVPQDPRWHPEGDVLTHTAFALDAWARLRPEHSAGMTEEVARDELVTALAVLTHDLGKAHTTEVDTDTGRIRAHGHEQAGADPARALVHGLSAQSALADEVAVLVAHHLAPVQLHQADAGDAAIRRLANRVGRIDRLVWVAHADQAGRPAPGNSLEVGAFPAGEWLLERAATLGVARTTVQPFVGGKDVLAAGLAAGPQVGALLRRVAQAQEDGEVTSRDDALSLVSRLVDELR